MPTTIPSQAHLRIDQVGHALWGLQRCPPFPPGRSMTLRTAYMARDSDGGRLMPWPNRRVQGSL
eukprot:9777164-Alexandrium_andersonii.AAC.1